MIHIGKPFIESAGKRSYLKAPVKISDDTADAYVSAITPYQKFCVWLTGEDYPPCDWKEDGTLWFDVPSEYEQYLCEERSNSFVVALFWYAMVSGSDIEFEAPMSKRLYEGLTERVMPALAKNGYPSISIKGSVTDEPVWCEGGVVTGMSGGVDSFYTLETYTGVDIPEEKRLTHLSYYTCDHLFKPAEVYKGVDALFEEEDRTESIILGRVKTIARKKNMPLIDTNSNLERDYYRGGLTFTGMYRFLACTLALEHLYGTYISSSSGHADNLVDVSLFSPTQHYENLLCDSLRTETFFYTSSDSDLRTEKIRVIADDPIFQKYAIECFAKGPGGENCGVCYGCMKTLIPLDMLGKLDAFRDSFDIDAYYRDRIELFRSLISYSKQPESSSAREIVRQLVDLARSRKSEAGRLFIELMK